VKMTEKTLVLLNNGFPHHGGPYEATLQWLIEHRSESFAAVRHPLDSTQLGKTDISVRSQPHGSVAERARKRPNLPPFTYLIDMFILPKTKVPRIWVTFNPLSAVRAIIGRAWRDEVIVLWSVDFVPVKSSNSFIQRIYKFLDKYSHKRVNLHWEVSEAAVAARALSTGIDRGLDHYVVPMGIWENAFHVPNRERFDNRRICYFGNVNTRNGIEKLLEIVLCARGTDITFEIIGGGELQDSVRQFIYENNLEQAVTYHGFLEDPEDAYEIMGRCAVGVAPFINDPKSFTAFADPSKFKAYLACGLPILTTEVPPNANELEKMAGAKIVSSSAPAETFLESLNEILAHYDTWKTVADSAFEYGQRFNWKNILDDNLAHIIDN
jgi:glycosyltransferase involved in cell wall biosynthesis